MFGGKADSLLKLQAHGFPIPDFFVIDVKDYQNFLEENHILETIQELLINDKRDQIPSLIIQGKVSKQFENKIKENLKKFSCSLVSVRSSALNEDGKNKAFAGQYDSYLNVRLDEVIEKIKMCWISFYNENVNEYFKSEDVLGMNVIVQKMIPADYAGVAFSKDSTSDTEHYSIIEMVKGLGENLVSGKITPTKFLVRRETKHVDLKIGDISIDSQIIEKLEEMLLEIEKINHQAMDVEYAIVDKKIFLLQARPITAKNFGIKPFSLAITRPQSLIESEISYKGEYEGIQKITRNLYYFKPLFVYNPKNENVEVYYNELDLEEDPRLMYYYMDLDFEKIEKYFNHTIQKNIVYIKDVLAQKRKVNLSIFVQKILSIYPFISLGQLAGHYENISERLRNFLIEFRNHYDSIVHEACDYILERILKDLPLEYKTFVSFLTLEEYFGKLPTIQELQLRTKGYIFYEKLYTTSSYEKWFLKHHISIEVIKDTSFNGSVAYSKNAMGRVCIVYSEKDFSKFRDGDILVTPMTVPKFMNVIKRAGGIITDEGGVTCHACIIARELKISCVVGCKNATKVLKDGDIVKVDGATGNITKI